MTAGDQWDGSVSLRPFRGAKNTVSSTEMLDLGGRKMRETGDNKLLRAKRRHICFGDPHCSWLFPVQIKHQQSVSKTRLSHCSKDGSVWSGKSILVFNIMTFTKPFYLILDILNKILSNRNGISHLKKNQQNVAEFRQNEIHGIVPTHALNLTWNRSETEKGFT